MIAIQTIDFKVIHVAGLAHSLHRLAEKLRGKFSDFDKVVSSVKQVFRKAPICIQSFI